MKNIAKIHKILMQDNFKNLTLFRYYSKVSHNISHDERSPSSSVCKSLHCYRNLHPWENSEEFSKYLISCIEYNKDGLLVLNKPYGIKIHGHDKPGTRPKSKHQFIIPSIPQCDFTVEDSLPVLQEHFNLPNLSIIKSAERYTSGIVLLSSSDAVTKKVQKSFNIAKFQKKPHLVHWAITLGYPVVPYRKEKVAIKFVEIGKDGMKQPVIVTDYSKNDAKKQRVYTVNVEYRTLSSNVEMETSLIEVASSSVRFHFVRVYASSRAAPILGDIMYGYRMKKFLGVPIKAPLTDSGGGFENLPSKMSAALNLPYGTTGQLMIPNMLHLRSMILPEFYRKGHDFVINVSLPFHFKWTTEKLKLLLNL